MITPAHRARSIADQTLANHRQQVLDEHKFYIDNLLQSIDESVNRQASTGAFAATIHVGNVTLGVTNAWERRQILEHVCSQLDDAGYSVRMHDNHGSTITVNWDIN